MTADSRIAGMLLAVAAAFASPAYAGPDSWVEQARQVDGLERRGQLSAALGAATRLVGDLKRMDSGNETLPLVIDRKASMEEDLGRYQEAERDYAEAIKIWRSKGDGRSRELATELNNLASLYSVLGERGKGEALRRESLGLRLERLGSDAPETALSYSNLGVDLYREKRYAESEEACRQALAIWSKTKCVQSEGVHSESDRSDVAWNTLALIELHRRNFNAALSLALAALERYRTKGNRDAYHIAGYLHTVALAREAAGQFDLAEGEFQDAVAILGGPERSGPSLVRIGLLSDYARLLSRLRRKKEARQVHEKALSEWKAMVLANQWQYTVDVQALLPDK